MLEARYRGGRVATVVSSRFCSLSIWDVVARIFSVKGPLIGVGDGSGSRTFWNVEVTVINRVFLTVPTWNVYGDLMVAIS